MPTTAEQQLALELINRARTDPGGEFDALISNASTQTAVTPEITSAIRYFDVDMNLLRSQLDALPSVQPLAWNENLAQSALTHTELMVQYDQQSHFLPGEPGIGDRMINAGYEDLRSVAENIFAYAEDVLYAHAGFYIDWGNGTGGMQDPAGHRNAILNATYDEVGISWVEDTASGSSVGPFLTTQHLGTSWTYEAQLVGVVIDDLDNDDFYDIGEGIGNVTVTASGANGTFTTTSWASGGYQMVLPDGAYEVTFSGSGLGGAITTNVTIAGENVKLDVEAGATVASAVPQDLDGSGYSEILLRDSATGSTGYWNFATGTVDFTGLGRAGTTYAVEGIGDYSGDGADDILWRDGATGAVGYWDLSSGAAQWTGLGRPGDFEIIGSGDFSGDGQDEILLRASNGVTGYWDLSSGAAQWTGLGRPGTAWQIEGIGDYNGDDVDDILWRDTQSATTGFWDVSNGSPAWTGLGRAGMTYETRGSGDFNGDGVDEILFRETVSGSSGYWDVSTGSPNWTGLGRSPSTWEIEAVGNYNNDAFDDILWRDDASRATGYWDLAGGSPDWTGLGRPGEGWDIVGTGPDDYIL